MLSLYPLRVLAKHPSLSPELLGGALSFSRAHLEIELKRSKELFDDSLRRRTDLKDLSERFLGEICHHNAFLYGVCRTLRPTTVVETGVWRGESTSFILQALQDNGSGALWSIDLPNATEQLPRGLGVGYIVPESLRKRWTLLQGDSRVELPRLLQKLGSIDLFFHDSLHTYDHMLFEFRQAWSPLRRGGMLLSDDVSQNAAFLDFCKELGLKDYMVVQRDRSPVRIGLALKD